MKKWLVLPWIGGRPFASLSLDGNPLEWAQHDTTDAERFAALVPPHAAVMLRVAASLIGPADAEDAAQEAVMRAWQSWAQLRDHTAVRGWLLTITVNVCRQWQRGGFGRWQRSTQSLSADNADQLAIFQDDPGASDHSAAMDLRHALNQLDRDLRVIVVLRYYGGMNATEIGGVLGISAVTARTRLRRALGKLREQLEATDDTTLYLEQQGDIHA